MGTLIEPSAELLVPSHVAESVLVVDDEKAIAQTLTLFLEQGGFTARAASGGEEALELLAAGEYFLVITDISMPDMDGLTLLGRIRSEHPSVDVIFITGHVDARYAIQAIKDGAFDFFRKPFSYDQLVLSVHRARERQQLIRRAFEVEKHVERTRVITQHIHETVLTFAAMIDAKSAYTRSHSERVASFAVRLAQAIGLDEAVQESIHFGGCIHDIGKIGIPDSVLDKPGKLSGSEWEIMRRHPIIGAECLRKMSCLDQYLSMVEFHHEAWDGSGYPHGLSGDDVPLEARIVKIADYWDAITSKRPYRDPIPREKSIAILEEERGRALDPDLTEIFLDAVPRAMDAAGLS